MQATEAYTEELADLERLAAELTARGLKTELRTPDGMLPCVEVHNPRASVLAERIYAADGSFWWSWTEKITGCDQAAHAADIIARVLAATASNTGE
jgi:hypothetical protein